MEVYREIGTGMDQVLQGLGDIVGVCTVQTYSTFLHPNPSQYEGFECRVLRVLYGGE